MFRATSENPFQGPHQNIPVARSGIDPDRATGAIVMIHGRGASAESILTLAHEFDTHGLHLAAPRASGHQWYPTSFMAPTEQNEPGLSSGLQAIYDIISNLESQGISKEKIILLGFSQGACLATEFIARHPAQYGGLIAFSGGLIGETVSLKNYSGSLEHTPCFLGCSDIDPHIPRERVHTSGEILESLGASVTVKIYPGMGHTINQEEISKAQLIVRSILSK